MFAVVATTHNQDDNFAAWKSEKDVACGLLAVALLNELVEFVFPGALFMFSFLCHKPKSDT